MIAIPNRVTVLIVETELADARAEVSATLAGPHESGSHPVRIDGGKMEVSNLPVGDTVVAITVTAEDRVTTCDYTLVLTRAPSDDATLSSLGTSVGDVDFAPGTTAYQMSVPSSAESLTLSPITTHSEATIRVAATDHRDGIVEVVHESFTEEYTLSSLPTGDVVVAIIVTAEDGETTKTYTITLERAELQEVDYDALLWSLIGRDDLSGAYWIARSLEARGLTPAVPQALLKATQGARWLSPYSDRYMGDLAEIVSQTEPPVDSDAEILLGLAASLMPSSTKPGAIMLGWLSTPASCPTIEQIVSPIRDFANRGFVVRPEDAEGR